METHSVSQDEPTEQGALVSRRFPFKIVCLPLNYHALCHPVRLRYTLGPVCTESHCVCMVILYTPGPGVSHARIYTHTQMHSLCTHCVYAIYTLYVLQLYRESTVYHHDGISQMYSITIHTQHMYCTFDMMVYPTVLC